MASAEKGINGEGVGHLWSKMKEYVDTADDDIYLTIGNCQTGLQTLDDRVDELFTSVSNGKTLVANAITDKGVTTSSDDTFATMAINISKIVSGGSVQFLATITTDPTAIITATKGNLVVTGVVPDSGSITLTIPEEGSWEFQAEYTDHSIKATYYSEKVTLHFYDYVQEKSIEINKHKVFGIEMDYSGSAKTVITRLTPSTDPSGLVTDEVTVEPIAESTSRVGSSPFDTIYPWSAMKEYNVIDNHIAYSQDDEGFSRTDYDTVVYIPEFYFYTPGYDSSTEKTRYYISDKPMEGFIKHPGSGNRYVGRYQTDTDGYSKTNLTPVKETRANHRTTARSKGNGWYLYDYATWCAIWILYLVEYADTNSQAKIGYGNTYGNSPTIKPNGYTDNMTYHTGTNGASTGYSTSYGIQYRHIENLWGNAHIVLDGFNFKGNSVYVCLDPQYCEDSVTNSENEHYISFGTFSTTYGIPSYTITGSNVNYQWRFQPAGINTGTTTASELNNYGFCDWYDNVSTGTSFSVYATGGALSTLDEAAGLFSLCNNGESSAFAGSRLMFIEEDGE